MPAAVTLRRWTSDEQGHTLPELLVAMTCGMIVLLASFTALEAATRRSTEVQGRVDATQRGRLAMDTMTRSLRSQVRSPAGEPAIVTADGSSLTYYADFSKGDRAAERRVLRHDPATSRITEATYVPTGTTASATYPAAPTSVRTVLADVYVPEDSPVFRYWAYNGDCSPKADVALNPPLVDEATRTRVARIQIAYVTRPTGAIRPSRAQVQLISDVYVRSANPNDEAPRPSC